MLRALISSIQARDLIPQGSHVLVAVSGGCDSTALLHLLAELRGALQCSLSAAHLNHRLRGAESEADEAFVRALCARLGVPLVVGAARVARRASESGVSLEMAAREARHRFLAKALRETGADRVALAHTRNDQAETVLLRVLRGAGVSGLGGMRWVSRVARLHLIRPLLGTERDRLADYLRRRGEPWREDASNADTAMLRNRIRHELLPVLRERYNPRVDEALSRLADLAAAEDAWMDALAADLRETCRPQPGAAGLSVPDLSAAPLAARRRVLHRLLLEGRALPSEGVHDLVDRADSLLLGRGGTRRLDLGEGRQLVRRYGWMGVESVPAAPGPASATRLKVPGETALPAFGLMARVERAAGYVACRRGRPGVLHAEAWLDAAWVGRAGLRLRAWRPGDRLTVPGLRGSKKIQDLLVDAKVPVDRRARYPVVECRGVVVWAPGFSVASEALVRGTGAPSLRIVLREA